VAAHQTGTDRLLVEVTGPAAIVTLNNPAKRNALSADMRAALPGLLRALNADSEVRVIVVTGAGDKAFASGADISEFGEQRTSPAARAGYDEA
jgi:enoyl-CoA hydratase